MCGLGDFHGGLPILSRQFAEFILEQWRRCFFDKFLICGVERNNHVRQMNNAAFWSPRIEFRYDADSRCISQYRLPELQTPFRFRFAPYDNLFTSEMSLCGHTHSASAATSNGFDYHRIPDVFGDGQASGSFSTTSHPTLAARARRLFWPMHG